MNPMETTSVAWHFPMLIVTVSLVYSATRFESWNQIFPEAIRWGLQMTFFLAGIGIGLHVFTSLDFTGRCIAAGCFAVAWLGYVWLTGRRTSRG